MWDWEGVVGCGVSLVQAMRSNTALHMSATSALGRTSFMSVAVDSILSVLEVILTTRLGISPMREVHSQFANEERELLGDFATQQ